jgi:alpha-D-ribose 1-methylphosphonate 5-triphosphate synthase subunit PhnI
LPHLIEQVDVAVVDSEVNEDNTRELINPTVRVQRLQDLKRGGAVRLIQCLHESTSRINARLAPVRTGLLLVFSPLPPF